MFSIIFTLILSLFSGIFPRRIEMERERNSLLLALIKLQLSFVLKGGSNLCRSSSDLDGQVAEMLKLELILIIFAHFRPFFNMDFVKTSFYSKVWEIALHWLQVCSKIYPNFCCLTKAICCLQQQQQQQNTSKMKPLTPLWQRRLLQTREAKNCKI